MRLGNTRNIADLQELARRHLPAAVFHFMEGGADAELSLQANIHAFEEWQLVPRYLVDVARVDASTMILKRKADFPVLLSPTGMTCLFHRDKELAVARAAGKFNVPYALSMMSSTTIEDTAGCGPSSRVFQIKILKDRALARELMDRAKSAGYDTLCILVDAPVPGNKERDLYYGMTMPPRINLRAALGFAARPLWTARYFLRNDFSLANFSGVAAANRLGLHELLKYVANQTDRSATWTEAAWMASEWNGHCVLKGIQSAEDAIRAVSEGFDSIMVSNQGGRQLDGGRPPMDCISEIRSAVGSNVELIVDGGVRRGGDVVKAIAAGANSCSIGRPYLYGLAAGGQAGVERCLGFLKADIERCMALIGCASVAAISSKHIHRKQMPIA